MKTVLTIITLVLIVAAQSQSRGGHFKGIVTNVKGAPIKEAKITVEGPNLKQSLRSDRLGQFEVHLAPGTYRIIVQKSGFADYQLTDLKIESNGTHEFTFKLELRNTQS